MSDAATPPVPGDDDAEIASRLAGLLASLGETRLTLHGPPPAEPVELRARESDLPGAIAGALAWTRAGGGDVAIEGADLAVRLVISAGRIEPGDERTLELLGEALID